MLMANLSIKTAGTFLAVLFLSSCGGSGPTQPNTSNVASVEDETPLIASVVQTEEGEIPSAEPGKRASPRQTFKVVAAGTAPITYQWYLGNVSIAGAVNAQHTTSPSELREEEDGTLVWKAPLYVVASSGGSGIKLTARLVQSPLNSEVTTIGNEGGRLPIIENQPESPGVKVWLNQTATLSVKATSSLPLSYRWFKNNIAILGATKAQYVTPPVVSTDEYESTYEVLISTIEGSVISRSVKVTTERNVPSLRDVELRDEFAFPGAAFTFGYYNAPGFYSPSVQWYRNGVALSISDSISYKPIASIEDNGALYSVTITTPNGSVTSRQALLTVNEVGRTRTTAENFERLKDLYLEFAKVTTSPYDVYAVTKDVCPENLPRWQIDGLELSSDAALREFYIGLSDLTLDISFSTCKNHRLVGNEISGHRSIKKKATRESISWYDYTFHSFDILIGSAIDLRRSYLEKEYKSDTTANGSASVTLFGAAPGERFATYRVWKVTPGARLKNNESGNVATFISGFVQSIPLNNIDTRRDEYNDVSFTIGNVRYVVSGSFTHGYIFGKNSGKGYYDLDERTVTAFVNDVQVAQYKSGATLPPTLVQIF